MAMVRCFVYCWEPGIHCWDKARRANSLSKGASWLGVKFWNLSKWDWEDGGGII